MSGAAACFAVTMLAVYVSLLVAGLALAVLGDLSLVDAAVEANAIFGVPLAVATAMLGWLPAGGAPRQDEDGLTPLR